MLQGRRKEADIKKARPSVVIRNEFEESEGEETEIAAQVTVPPDGGWGWVVVVASFCSLLIVDGIVFSFGPLLPDMSKDLKIEESLVVLVNSLQCGTYYILSPISSGLVNRFGFRITGMVGSIICSVSAFAAHYSRHFLTLLLLYGFINGLGCSMTSLACNVIVGFYFQKLRSIVLPILSGGSSVGIIVIYQLHVLTVKSGWKTSFLLQSGLFGVVYFLTLTFRPLLTLTVIATKEEGNPTRTVTYLPNISATRVQPSPSGTQIKPTNTERLMRAVSNAHFPTAKAFVEDAKIPTASGQPGTSTAQGSGVSRITLKTQNLVSQDQLKKMQSIISARNLKDVKQQIEITIEVDEQSREKTCFGRCCDWHRHPPEFRPMYRDDVFYNGQIEKLPAYQKSMKNRREDEVTGLEYQLEVVRAVQIDDLNERVGIFTTAMRRILATMLDLSLLKRASFLSLCIGGFLLNSGSSVPYLFLQARGEANGLDPSHSAMLVSVLSVSNLIGRILLLLLSIKIETIYVFAISVVISGITTIVSSISYTPLYQYGYCVIFGLSISASTSLRGLILVDICGLENLSNGFGIMLMFNGIAVSFCTPLGAYLISCHGYDLAFYVAGGFITLSGIVSFLIKPLKLREEKQQQLLKARTIGKPSK